MLDSLPMMSQEIILANMRQSASLTIGILKSLYPRADLDVAGEGFMVTCSDEEALKLVEDSAMMVGQVVDMLGVDITISIFLHVTMLSQMEIIFTLVRYVMRKFWTRLTMSYLFSFPIPNNSLTETKISIVRLISFLHEFLTCLLMIQSHVELTFQNLFSLSVRILPLH
jgi:hypothetical protein